MLKNSLDMAIGRLIIAAAVLVALMLLPLALFAQEDGTIEYPENDTGAVAAFTAVDPEIAGAITWSLKDDDATDDDAADFAIDKSSGVLSFKKSPNYEMATGGGEGGTAKTYTVTVVATDADGMPSEEEVTIEVTNVEEAGKVTLDKVAPYPGVALMASLNDPDLGVSASEWQWARSRNENGSYTDIEGASAKADTYEPTSGDVGYYLRATVSYDDGEGDGKSAMATSANQVQAINEPNAAPAFPDQDPETPDVQNDVATRMVGENADAGANVGAPVAAEDDDSDILTYTLGDGGSGDAGSFAIDQATGQITVGADAELNFESPGKEMYMVMVTATDPAGETPAVINVTINVVDDANEPPAITGEVTESIMENTDTLLVVRFMADDPDNNNTDITWSLGGPDAGDFTIEEGALTFRASPNYEKPADADGDNVYEVTVAASDADSNRGEKSVEVKVANVNEDGTVTLSAVQPRVGVSLTASLTDIDGGVSDVKWQWNNGTDIVGATSDTYTPTVDDLDQNLKATASYTDAEGPEKTAVGELTNTVAADTRNKAPVFDDQDGDTEGTQNTEAERTIAENSTANTALNGGDSFAAEDPNADDDLTYTLSGPDASSFDISSIDATEGQITVGAGTKLDFEMKSTYRVTAIATDSFGESASIDVTITVIDVNEGPVITGPAEAEYAENGTGPAAAFTAADPEIAGAITWSLKDDDATDDDAADFAIDKSSGVLSFKKSPNYEMATGGGEGGTAKTYTVTVVATDADGMPSEEEVTIEVTNVEEAGKVTLDKVAPYPGVALMASLNDPDLGVSASEWQWARSRNENGSYTDIEGASAKADTYETDERRRGLLPEGDGFIRRRRGRRQERDGHFGQPGTGDQRAERRSCVPRPGPRDSRCPE